MGLFVDGINSVCNKQIITENIPVKINCGNLQTFVICLAKKSAERCDVNMESIKSVFPKAKETVAIDASNINLSSPQISYYARYHIKNNIESDFMHMGRKGAVGCALSHIQLWRKCVELNEPIIIVEDDMFLDTQKGEKIQNVVSQIPKDCDFAGIMYNPVHTESDNCTEQWCEMGVRFAGIQLYYITPRGATILLRDALPVVVHIDQYIAYVASVLPEFKAMYWKNNIYSFSEMYDDHKNTTLHSGNLPSIRKILPNENTFYIVFSLGNILLMIFLIVVIVVLLNKKS